MARESNPSHPDEDGAWFKMRENGNYVDVFALQGSDSDDPKLGWMPLTDFTTHQIPVSALLLTFALKSSDGYNLYLDESSQQCAADSDIVDLDSYGLTSDNAIVIEAYDKTTNEDDDDGRDYPDNNLHTKGYWFVVQDEDGNDIDVSGGAQEVGSSDSLGWNPIPNDSSLPTDHVPSGRIKKKICQSLDLDPQDYKLYASQSDDASDVFDDNYVVDFGSVGLKRNDPMLVKYEPGDDNNSDNNSNSGNEGGQGNGQDDDSGDTNRWVDYTRQVQNITFGDWSSYPDTIRGLQPGEILWTDGNASYCYASAPTITAYQVVRRSPNTSDGAVTEFGFVSASPYYFRLLD